MLKLTQCDTNNTVWVWPRSIAAIIDMPTIGSQLCTDGIVIWVVETADQIIAMPEMKGEIDRAVLATLPPSWKIKE